MVEVTENEKRAIKLIFTDFLANHNSYNIKGKLGLSNAGSLKLLRRLSEKDLLVSRKMGNAIFYRPNLRNEYLLKLLELIFLDQSSESSFVKGWIHDILPLALHTKAILLYGSILKKGKEANDVDVCIILKKSEDYHLLQGTIKKMNEKNRLKIHPLYLTEKDFEKKLEEKDKPILDIIKSCIVAHGQELFVELLKKAQNAELFGVRQASEVFKHVQGK